MTQPVQTILVYPADTIRVSIGANMGDPLGVSEDLMCDDIYRLTGGTRRMRLPLAAAVSGDLAVAPGGETGRPGAAVHLDCLVTLMSPDGQTQDAIVLVELDEVAQSVAAVHVLPLAPLAPQTDYTLVGISRERLRERFAQVGCVSFARGTHITLVSGEQRRIEDLKIGDQVLTRDDGGQSIRWIGQTTVRGVGDLAPVLIERGALNNANDLLVSPDHRLFVYQREDHIGAGRSEIMVKARHLLNGDTVRIVSGGFVDYFQLVFDRHHIIYAEGISAESMLIDPHTRPALPVELLNKLTDLLPGHSRPGAHGLDVQRALLDRPDAIDLLRRASGA